MLSSPRLMLRLHILCHVFEMSNLVCEPGKAQMPALLLTSILGGNDYPLHRTLSCPVSGHWWSLLAKQVSVPKNDYRNIPEFEIRSIAIFSHTFCPSGRQIKLDMGSVREFRDYARMFIIGAVT